MQTLRSEIMKEYYLHSGNIYIFLFRYLLLFSKQMLVFCLFLPIVVNSVGFKKSNVVEKNKFLAASALSFDKQFKRTLKNSGVAAHQVGIIVADLDNTLYQMNADKNFIPASLMKVFTASTLLDLLSPSLQFTTRFFAESKIKNSVLNGNLYLKGGGDPGFVSESLWNLVNNLKRTGLKTIAGDLIVDDSRFNRKKKGERLSYSSHFSYDAPVGALSFNWNTANIYLRSGKKIGQPLSVYIDPSPSYFLSIKNKTRTEKKNKRKNISIQRKKEGESRESLEITGQMPFRYGELLVYRNILYPAIWTGWNAVDFLKQRGIYITGQVKKGAVPKKASVLAEWHSRPLVEHIKLMMKYSNNFMVEMLVKNMVVELTGKKGHLKEGLEIIKKHIKKLGIEEAEYSLVQASGLSRKNKLKPRHLKTVLQYWLNHPLQAEFESAFPLAGEDGTLKKYFKNTKLKGRIHAKTGSINGVVGLSGYLITKKGEKRIFVFLFNGPSTLKRKVEKLFRKWAFIIFNQD